jgi:hypothetical protein
MAGPAGGVAIIAKTEALPIVAVSVAFSEADELGTCLNSFASRLALKKFLIRL